MEFRGVMQILRVLLLAGILLATVPLMRSVEAFHTASLRELESATGAWVPWVLLTALTWIFAAVLLAGRGDPQPRWILVVQAAVAAVLGLIPPAQWSLWLGASAANRVFGTLVGPVSFIQPLALVWFAVVVRNAIRPATDSHP